MPKKRKRNAGVATRRPTKTKENACPAEIAKDDKTVNARTTRNHTATNSGSNNEYEWLGIDENVNQLVEDTPNHSSRSWLGKCQWRIFS
jgi:hypothetical protein